MSTLIKISQRLANDKQSASITSLISPRHSPLPLLNLTIAESRASIRGLQEAYRGTEALCRSED